MDVQNLAHELIDLCRATFQLVPEASQEMAGFPRPADPGTGCEALQEDRATRISAPGVKSESSDRSPRSTHAPAAL